MCRATASSDKSRARSNARAGNTHVHQDQRTQRCVYVPQNEEDHQTSLEGNCDDTLNCTATTLDPAGLGFSITKHHHVFIILGTEIICQLYFPTLINSLEYCVHATNITSEISMISMDAMVMPLGISNAFINNMLLRRPISIMRKTGKLTSIRLKSLFQHTCRRLPRT